MTSKSLGRAARLGQQPLIQAVMVELGDLGVLHFHDIQELRGGIHLDGPTREKVDLVGEMNTALVVGKSQIKRMTMSRLPVAL